MLVKLQECKESTEKKVVWFLNEVKRIILNVLNWTAFLLEMFIWVIPSILLDIYMPVFILIGGGTRFYNFHNPGKSLGFSKNIIMLEGLKTFP